MPRPPIENARDRLLSAALNLFARRGTERVNSNAIARRAGLGIGTFYNHFPDKHALLREIQIRTVSGLRAARVEALRGAGVRPVDQVRASVGAAIDFASDHAEAYRVTFGRERAGAAAHGPVVTESSRPTAEALDRLKSVGRLDASLDVELAARAYSAMEVGTILWWLEDSNRAARDALAETLARMHPAISAS